MPNPELRFRRKASFRRAFDALPASQQASAKRAFAIFRRNIFDPRLKNHVIQRLSARYGVTVRAVWIEADLRAIYCQEGNAVIALDVGSHDIYR